MSQKNVKFVGNSCTNPISTILYMSESDLHERLKILTSQVKMQYVYICHNAESENSKNHIHFICRPLTKGFTNISRIRELLFEIAEIDTENFKKGQSIPCKPFVESKSIRDWYLYSMHNKDYLSQKGETREFEYTHNDFKGDTSFINDMLYISNNHTETESESDKIINFILMGKNDLEILTEIKPQGNNIYSFLLGLKELRKHIEIPLEVQQELFYNEMYLHICDSENGKNLLKSERLGIFNTRSGKSDKISDVMRVLWCKFIDTLSEQDLINMYFE